MRDVVTIAALLWLIVVPAQAVDLATPQVLDSFPHDTNAFTQGFLYYNGFFFESTGQYGQSTLRRNDPTSGVTLQQISINPAEFGEGLARIGNELIQITWKENVAHRYTLQDFWLTRNYNYAGDGWGICHDGERLVMTNGGSHLTFRDPETFAVLGSVQVRMDGLPISWLNELECVGRLVYANVWNSEMILRIDPETGVVLTRINAYDLLTPQEEAQAGVLNGIAFHPVTEQFYLTGKLWPRVFEVDFDFNPYGGCEAMDDLSPIDNLRLGRDGSDGVAFTWGLDPQATEYHVNSVNSLEELAAPGPHRPDRNEGLGEARCDAAAPQTTCTDPLGQTDPDPLVLFQVFSACGPGGIDEGPR
jgi:glutamine cyclotransferase